MSLGEGVSTMMIVAFEVVSLLFAGVIAGIVSTMVDIYVSGAGSFVSHMLLWVFINVLIATHVESAARAVWWSIPINLGFIESYYIATSASFEGYPRNLMALFALLAILAPSLVFGLWTAKNTKNFYGWLLALLASGGSVAACYAVTGEISTFSIVIAVVSFALLTFIPTRKIKITPAERPELSPEELAELEEVIRENEERKAQRESKRRRGRQPVTVPEVLGEETPSDQVFVGEPIQPVEEERQETPHPRAPRPSQRKTDRKSDRKSERKTERKRRSKSKAPTSRSRRNDDRAARRAAASERRASREAEPEQEVAPLPTLGTTRPATSSRRYNSF